MKKIMKYFLPAACAVGMITVAHAQNGHPSTLADGTAVPIKLSHTINTAKAKPGDPITARTMQPVYAADHVEVPRGSLVTGHILSVTPYSEAKEQSARVALQFAHIQIGTTAVPIRLSVRAIASSYDAYNAEYLIVPQSQTPYAHAMIGGGRTTPGSSFLYSDNGDKIGYENKDGRFGALIASPAQDAEGLRCESTNTPQSLAIFSPSACGIYGFDHVTMQTLEEDSGAVQLIARQHNISLFSDSAMLLQVRESDPRVASR